MFQKLLRRDYSIHKLVLPITLAQKYGKINHMIAKAIYGVWDACFMKLLRYNHLLEQVIWMGSTKRF